MQERFQGFAVWFILIDGLDELEPTERREILDVLRLLVRANAQVRLFVSGRDSLSVDLPARFASLEHITMLPEDLAGDIRRYVDATVQEKYASSELKVSDPDLLDVVKDILSSEAEGM